MDDKFVNIPIMKNKIINKKFAYIQFVPINKIFKDFDPTKKNFRKQYNLQFSDPSGLPENLQKG